MSNFDQPASLTEAPEIPSSKSRDSAESGERGAETYKNYSELLGAYDDLFKRIKRLEKGGRSSFDERIQSQIQVLDKERHETHLRLLEAGQKLGRDATAVMIDIVRKQGNLEEYGLPEFALMQEGDVVVISGVWTEFRGISYSGEIKPYDLEAIAEDEKAVLTKKIPYTERRESVIPNGSCMIIYEVSPLSISPSEDEDERALYYAVDYRVREARAETLAKLVGGKVYNHQDGSSFHTSFIHLLGVIIPKEKLEEVAAIIRDNPMRYRIGDEYYSPEEKAVVEKSAREKAEEKKRVEEEG